MGAGWGTLGRAPTSQARLGTAGPTCSDKGSGRVAGPPPIPWAPDRRPVHSKAPAGSWAEHQTRAGSERKRGSPTGSRLPFLSVRLFPFRFLAGSLYPAPRLDLGPDRSAVLWLVLGAYQERSVGPDEEGLERRAAE